jgi:hypothetical protein
MGRQAEQIRKTVENINGLPLRPGKNDVNAIPLMNNAKLKGVRMLKCHTEATPAG